MANQPHFTKTKIAPYLLQHNARTQDAREKKKESCHWCGNHIKSTICLGVFFILLLAGILLTHLFIYWSKYLARVRPDDKVMSIGAIPFPAVTMYVLCLVGFLVSQTIKLKIH